MTVKVLNCSVPVSFGNIHTNNNSLVIGGVSYTLEAGNYNALSLRSHLNEVLSPNYTVAYDSITNKFSFTATNNFVLSQNSTCLKVLGFPEGQDATSTDSVLESTHTVDLSGENTLYISVANLGTTSNLSSSTGTRTNIVKSILVNVPTGGVIFHEDSSGDGGNLTIQEDHLSFLHIKLLGEDAQTCLDFDGVDWQMCVEIGCVPKESQPTLANSFEDFYRAYLDNLPEEL